MTPETTETNPFHKGELAIQDRLGVREKVAKYAPRMIRPFMPDQHREFFAALPYFFVGAVDDKGAPWASMLCGEAGFVSSPTPTRLTVKSPLAGTDPALAALAIGSEVGMLGIQFETRRRNRVNGRVTALSSGETSVEVSQSFGNCPQYIQARGITAEAGSPGTSARSELRASLSEADKKMIGEADTLMIATASADLGADERHGTDISHRGGAPGFVKTLEDSTLLIPDFSGNNIYNTLGNIHTNGRAGLLFMDFTTGDMLQLAGSAAILWPGDSPFTYEGALRYVHITPTRVVKHSARIPYRWQAPEMSPRLPKASGWYESAGSEL